MSGRNKELEFYKKSSTSVLIAKVIFKQLANQFPLKPIADVAETTSGGTPSRSNPLYWSGNIPWIKSGELNDGLINTAEETITDEGLKSSSAKLFPKGTLVLALYGATVGKTGILNFDSATNQAVCAIWPKEELLINEYLLALDRFKRERKV